MLPPPQMLRGTPWDLRDVRENTRRRFSPTSRRSQRVPRRETQRAKQQPGQRENVNAIGMCE